MTDNPVSRTAHNPPRVVSFGEILFDVIGGVPYLGGAPLNLAAHLRKQGAETTLISAVGNDPLGRDALEQIGKLGLDTGTIAVLDGFPTGTVTVLLDERKVAAYDFAMDTAYDHIPVPGFDTEVDLFCFGTLAQRSPESRGTLARLRKMLDCLFFYDVNLRQDFYSKAILEESLYSADIVKLNEDEFPVLAAMFGLPDDPEELRRRFVPADTRPEAGLLKLRKSLNLFANLRPAVLYSELKDACPLKAEIADRGFDMMIMRELTGGLYFGARKTETVDGGVTATDTLTYNENEIRRIAIRAFDIAMKRRKKVTSVDKANVLDSSRL